MPLARFADAAYSNKSVKGYLIDKSLTNQNYTTYYNPKDKTAVISFSGTRIFNDPNYFGIPKNGVWETDLATDWAIANNDIRGSLRYDQCLTAAESFYSKYHGEGYHVATTGHSLGGRIAMEISADLRADHKTMIAEVYNPFFYDSRVDIEEGDYDYCIVHYNPNDPYSRNVAHLPSHGHATLLPSTPQSPYQAVIRRNPNTQTPATNTTTLDPANPVIPPTTSKPIVPPTSSKPVVPPTTSKPVVPPTTSKPSGKPPAHHKESIWHWLGKEAKHHPWEFAAAVLGGAVIAAGAAAIIGPAIIGAIAGEGAVEGVAAAGVETLAEGATESVVEGVGESAVEGAAEDTATTAAENTAEIPTTDPAVEPTTPELTSEPGFEEPEGMTDQEVVDAFGSDSIPELDQQVQEMNEAVDDLNFSDAEAPTSDAERALFRSRWQKVADEILDLGPKILRKSVSLGERIGESVTENAQAAIDNVSETAGRQGARSINIALRSFMDELSTINPALSGYLKSILSIGQTLGVVDSATASAAGVTAGITLQTQIVAATGVVMTGVVFIQTVKEFFQACKLFVQEMSQLVNLIKQNQKEIDKFLEELVGLNSHALNQYTSHEPTSVLPGAKSSTANLSTVSTLVHKPTSVLPAQQQKHKYVVKAKYNHRH